jgi:enterochelin esterase family protein
MMYSYTKDSERQPGVPRGTITQHHFKSEYIREWARRELRVFLQSGENDLDTQFGNWWLCNLQMAKALEFRKYDQLFVGGKGGHDGNHGGAILPDSMRWLWRH